MQVDVVIAWAITMHAICYVRSAVLPDPYCHDLLT